MARYVVLLRGINVGTAGRMDMKELKVLIESIGCTNVSTYINSGNVLLNSSKSVTALKKMIESAITGKFSMKVPLLVLPAKQAKAIAAAVPASWKNDDKQRTDVAYLFSGIDTPGTAGELPMNRDLVRIRYVKGAIIWNILRKDYGRSKLNKLISHPLYKSMTIRNVNSARALAKMAERTRV